MFTVFDTVRQNLDVFMVIMQTLWKNKQTNNYKTKKTKMTLEKEVIDVPNGIMLPDFCSTSKEVIQGLYYLQ